MASNYALLKRVVALAESIKATTQLITRLSKLSPDTHSTSPDASTTPEEARVDLTADIQEALRQQEEELELLKQDVDDTVPASGGRRSTGGANNRREMERERDAVRLAASAARVEEDLKTARTRFRRAQLQAKRNADQASQRERAAYISSLQAAAAQTTTLADGDDEPHGQEQTFAAMSSALFAGRRVGGPRKDPKATQDDLMLSATSDVTASLRRTHALLASEVSRSRFAQETLDSSNKALEELNEKYSGLDTMLSQSKGLLNSLLRSNKSDTWYLETAYMVLAATIGWLVFRRFLYGPMWWFVWLPIRTVLYSTLWILGAAFGLVSKEAEAGGVATTTSLKVMPSAAGKIPERLHSQGAQVSAARSASAGSRVAASEAGSLSESIGTMVESMASEAMAAMGTQAPSVEQGAAEGHEQGQQQGQQDQRAGQAQGQRGDGQPLRQRDEATEPRNPKKRMMEEPAAPQEQQQQQQQRDEL